MSADPAQTIREYLDGTDGQTEVPFARLLTSWGLQEASAADRARITDELAAAGISTEPPLTELAHDDQVRLRFSEAQSPPPWQTQSAPQGAPTAEPAAPRRRGPQLALVAGVLLAALAAAAGGYVLGKGTGEDLDAAREAGRKQGEREGTTRGTERGYEAGFKEGRRAGYKETYKRAYERAYKKELREAGVTPPEKVKVPDAP